MNQEESSAKWTLVLYVASMTPAARRALGNIEAVCQQYLEGQYSIEVIDLRANPALAETDQIFAVPTLVRRLPLPLRKIIGDLADLDQVLAGLELRPAA
jgi:circadian clock protein KaiB